MELVEKDAVVVLATGVTTPTGMFPVLPDTPVARRDVPSLLAVLRVTRRLSFREAAAAAGAAAAAVCNSSHSASGTQQAAIWFCVAKSKEKRVKKTQQGEKKRRGNWESGT